jgi:arylsulfatase A-like enzyme
MRATTNPESLASAAAPRVERSSLSPFAYVAALAGTGLVTGLFDLGLALSVDSRGYAGLRAALPGVSLASALGFVVAGLAAVLARLLGRGLRAALLAALAGLVAFELDLLFARGQLDLSSLGTFAPSAALGLVVFLLALAALGREGPGRSPRTGSPCGELAGAALALGLCDLALPLKTSGDARLLSVVGLLAAVAIGCWLGARLVLGGGRTRAALVLGFVAALATVVRLPPAQAGGSSRPTTTGHGVPRVILVVVDTLRADALSCDSPSAPETPSLDRLASRAWRFAAARAPAPWTLPSMASMLTGVSPLVHRATRRDAVLPSGIPTLAERLADAGYRTAAIGHNYVLSPTRRLDRGFDEYRFSVRTSPPARSLGFLLYEAWRRHDPVALEPSAHEVTRRALDWIDAHASEDFFLWLHYYDPHLAYAPPAEFAPQGAPPHGLGWDLSFDAIERIRGGYLVPDSAARGWIRALYDGEVRYLDTELGRLFDGLEARGLLEDSLVIVTSDHGEEFFEHDGFEHGHSVYEELLRVPLIVKLPGQESGGTVDAPVGLEGLAPSVLALTGVTSEPSSFSATAWFGSDGEPAPAPPVGGFLGTGTLYYQDRQALLFDGWKYARDLVDGVEQLFDLVRDPLETRSLAAEEPERLAEARARCEEAARAAEELRARYGVGEGTRAELSEAEMGALQHLGYADDGDAQEEP